MDANKIDPIPAHFHSAEEAGEFWDTHSAADYWDEMEEVEMEFDIQERIFWMACKRFSGSKIRQFSTHHRTDKWSKA
jgi:hypothetical protein